MNNTGGGSSNDQTLLTKRIGGLEIAINVATPDDPKDPQSQPQPQPQPQLPSQSPSTPELVSTLGSGMQRSFSAVSMLSNFLPTGTTPIFATVLATIYREGQCSTLSTVMMYIFLSLCGIFCFAFHFTNSCSSNGKLYYGFVTCKGLFILNHHGRVPRKVKERFKFEWADLVHAIMSYHRVTDCVFHGKSNEVDQVMQSVVLLMAIVCSGVFLLFPISRHGFVPKQYEKRK